MKGLLLFLAGCLVGAAVLAWVLVESPSPASTGVAPPAAPPLPQVVDATVTDLDPAAPRVTTSPTETMPVGDVVEAPPLSGVPSTGRPPLPTTAGSTPPAAAVPDLNAPAGDDLDSGDPDAPLPPEATPVPAADAADAATTTIDVDAVTRTLPPLRQPVAGVAAAALADTYSDARGDGRLHDAIDIMAPRGTPVHAVADGRIEKLFLSVPGGNTIYQFDSGRRVAFYYAHLDRYVDGLAEGMTVKQGDLIGYVGHSGNASAAAPHLHFAIFVLGPEKRWWQGTAINPYPLLRSARDAP